MLRSTHPMTSAGVARFSFMPLSSPSQNSCGHASRRMLSYTQEELGQSIGKGRGMASLRKAGSNPSQTHLSLHALPAQMARTLQRLSKRAVVALALLSTTLVILLVRNLDAEALSDTASRFRESALAMSPASMSPFAWSSHGPLKDGSRDKLRASAKPTPPAPMTDFFEEWLQFQDHHPISASDRLSFADVGFRAAVYEQAMRSIATIGEDRLREIEETLYPWMRDLHVLRDRHVSKKELSSGTMTKGKMDEASLVKRKPTQPGIVITAGNGQFRYVAQLINTIRSGHKCDMPIEVYFYGAEDLSRAKQQFLGSNFRNVRAVDMARMHHFDESFVNLKHGTWAMKPYAMMATNFTEVMLLDADCVLLADPHDFFHHTEYRKTGTLFFHDRFLPEITNDIAHTFIDEQIGLRDPSDGLAQSPYWEDGLFHRQESGLVMLDKSKPSVFATLLFILWQNAGPIRSAVTYNIFYGDKETFWYSFELAGMPYHVSPYYAGAIGPEESTHAEGFCSDHILHFFDAPIVHNVTAKHNSEASSFKGPAPVVIKGRPAWINGALRRNKLYDPDDSVMEIDESIWTMDGEWEWQAVSDTQNTVCKVNYTRHNMEDLSIGPVLSHILKAGQEADIMIAERLDDEEQWQVEHEGE